MSAVHKSEMSKEKDVFDLVRQFNFGELHFKKDEATGLETIIAIHSTKLGPALGGCRLRDYATTADALDDVLRLAQAMSYKAAMSDLPLGGGKSVIIKPNHIVNRDKLFESFGTFVHDLGGRYITAMDSGTTEHDMNVIARKTKHVASQSQPGGASGDPSPYTSLGIRLGIQAAVRHRLDKSSLQGLHIVIQGVGNVGYHLARELHQLGAKLSVSDINEVQTQRCAKEFDAKIISQEECYNIACDVFAPCALGGIINDKTLPHLKTPIIAGGANNQLLYPALGMRLFEKGILYAPDYVINAGGLIQAAALYFHDSDELRQQRIEKIHDRLLQIFARSDKEKRSTNEIADAMAQELIK